MNKEKTSWRKCDVCGKSSRKNGRLEEFEMLAFGGRTENRKKQIPDIVNVPRTDTIYHYHGYLNKALVKTILPFIE